MRTVTLRPGKSKPVWMGHPWVFADSIESVTDGEGDFVRVIDSRGELVGRGLLSEASAIRVRLLARGEGDESDEVLLTARIRAAVALRRRLFPAAARTDAYRLIHGEGDGVPGLVVDRFGSVLVAQFATRPMAARRDMLARLLLSETGASSLLSRAGGKEEEEAIDLASVPFTAGAAAPETVEIREEGMRLVVDLRRGQKTGHYADQRENRGLVAEISAGSRVLDLHAGTGGFSIRALLAGATSCVAVDSSGAALLAARTNAEANGVAGRLEAVEADALEHLDALSKTKTTFDVVIVDPPKLAASRLGVPKALDLYKRLNVRALVRTEPLGFLATFSCSGLVSVEAFAQMLDAAARECRRRIVVLRTLSAGPDHPVDAGCPEGRYLTGMLLRVTS